MSHQSTADVNVAVLPLERCDMSPRPRIASISVASAAAIGLCVAIGVAPPATAEPCTGAAAAVQPPAAADGGAETPDLPSSSDRRPTGQRPPMRMSARRSPGSVSCRQVLNSLSPRSAQVQQQAEVATPFARSARGRCAASSGRGHSSAAAGSPGTAAPPGTSLVGWVTGPDSPNDTIGRFAITGTDLGIMWDNGDPGAHQVLMAFGDTYGYCSVRGQQWRYNALFRSQDGALSNTISVPNGVVSNQYSGSPLWAPAFPNKSSTAPSGRRRRRGSFPPPASPPGETSTSTSCPSRAGTPTAHGRRTSRRSRCLPTTANTGASTPTPSARPDRTPSREPSTFREMRTSSRGRSSSPGPATLTSTRSGHRPDAAVRRTCRECSPAMCRTSENTNTGTPTAIPGFRAIRGLRRR